MAPTRRLNTLLLGTCMVHWPLVRTPVGRRGLACDTYGRPIEIHTFGQIFQLIELWQGTKRLSGELLRLARMPADIQPIEGAKDFHAIDLALVGPSTPIELTFRDVSVNRQALRHELQAHAGQDAFGLVHRWLTVGLERMNEAVRNQTGVKLLEHIRGDTAKAELARAVIRETRAEHRDVRAGFQKLCSLVRRPIGVILYYYHYMPDGRGLSWPAGFRDDVVAAAEELDLPVFDPAKLVAQHGLSAISKDQRHYSRDFLPLAGSEIVDFTRSVYGRPGRPDFR